MGKTESQIAAETLQEMSVANATKPWAADVEGLQTAERVWAKDQYGKAMKRVKQNIDLAWGNAQGEVNAAAKTLEPGATAPVNPIQKLSDMHELLMDPALPPAQRSLLQTQFGAELNAVAPQINPNLLKGILEESQKAQSLEALGKVGEFPQFSSSILKRAQKWMENGAKPGAEELIDQANRFLHQGAIQYIQLPKMGLENQSMAQFMLWMIFHEKTDEIMRPKTLITPDYPSAIAPGVIIDRTKKAPAKKPAPQKATP